MTINEAIEKLDAQKHNTCPRAEKIAWLSELDGLTRKLLFGEDFPGYGQEDAPLQIPFPFDSAYLYYMESKIDYQNGEFTRFNNAYAMFRAAWQKYADFVVRGGNAPQKPARFQ